MLEEFERWKKLHDFYKYSDYLTKDLADFLHVNPRTIQRWIKGTAKPNVAQLEEIRGYLSKESLKAVKNPQENPPDTLQ